MKSLSTVRMLSVLVLVMSATVFLAGEKRVEARLWFRKAFAKKYPQLAPQVKKVKCNVCHVPKKKKKVLNDYGQALKKALVKKKVKGKPLDVGLTKIEAAKNARGITFGSLIKAGKLPGTAPSK